MQTLLKYSINAPVYSSSRLLSRRCRFLGLEGLKISDPGKAPELPCKKIMNSPHIEHSLTQHFTSFIKASASGRRRTPSGKRITKGTITNYSCALKLLWEYQLSVPHPLRIRLLHRASLRTMQQEKNYWHRFFIRFSDFLYKEKGYSDNYVANFFKILRSLFNYLQKEKGLMVGNYHHSFRIPAQQAAPVVLTPAQLNFLICNKAFEAVLTPGLKRVKDIFVFGCTVALRYTDLMGLKKSNIRQVGTEYYLSLFTQKTNTEIRVPLPGYALHIVHKYQKKAGKYILPRLSSTNLNLQLKKLAKAAGWTQQLTKNISYRGKMQEQKNGDGSSWLFYQHITAHTMRRTAITTLLILGVPETVVRKISGHAPGSREFYKYVAIAQDYLDTEVKKAQDKLAAFTV